MSGKIVQLLAGTLVFIALGVLVNGLALGHPPTEIYPLPRPAAMRVSLDVLVDGQPVRQIHHGGRLYLPVPRMGAEYSLRVNNHGPHRIVAVLSVDGLSVLSGQPAAEDQPGYIVAAGGNVVIKGWRRDQHTVAAFTFAERERSYAYRMGHPENIGVIGLVAFEELVRAPRPFLEKRDSAAPGMYRSSPGVGETGTGWGRDIDSGIYYVSFTRSSNRRSITIYYDTVENLRRLGVPMDSPSPVPFPRDSEFCPPPPGMSER